MSHRSDVRAEIEREAGDLAHLFRRARERTTLCVRAGGAPVAAGAGARGVAGLRPAAPAARWLRAAGVLVALGLGAAGILFMGGDRYLLAEVRRTEGLVSLDRTGAGGFAENVSSGSRLRSGDVLQCGAGECTVELSTGCLLVLSAGGSVRLDRAADGSLRLTVAKGTLDFSTLLPRAFVRLQNSELLRCDGPASLKVLGGPDVEVRSGCVMLLRDARGLDTWSLIPCNSNASCSTRPR